eukprot:jgi/Chrzof1/5598/Cz16g08190.t1
MHNVHAVIVPRSHSVISQTPAHAKTTAGNDDEVRNSVCPQYIQNMLVGKLAVGSRKCSYNWTAHKQNSEFTEYTKSHGRQQRPKRQERR